MYKNYTNNVCWPNRLLPKILLTMKLTSVLLIVTIMQVSATGFAQKITIKQKNVSLEQLFKVITKQTGYNVLWVGIEAGNFKKIDLDFNKAPLNDVLKKSFENQSLTYEIENKTIIVRKSKKILIEPDQAVNMVIDISGRIVDADGKPLPGASVKVKGTTKAATADNGGNFQLKGVDESALLEVSFIGYVTVEVKASKDLGNIALKQTDAKLNDVVVVGYGTQNKRDLIGSVATVKAETFKTVGNSTNVLSLLQGQAAGVSVQSTSGKLGAGVNVLVRGVSSISAGTSPLYIIDGVPVIGDMSLVNQTDIESVQVLKDAAATSIYGSRGSNGVVLITTKSGVDGKILVSADYSTGISDLPLKKVKTVNTNQLFEMLDLSKTSNGMGKFDMETDYYSLGANITEKLTRDQALATNTDWKKEMMKNGSFHSANLSVVGGDKNVKYFVSGNYRTDEGVMKNDKLERYGLRANIDLKPTSHFDAGVRINLNASKRNQSGGSFNPLAPDQSNAPFSSIYTTPMLPVYSLANPTFYLNPKAGNPAALNDRANNLTDYDIYRVLVGTYAEYRIPFVDGLSARTEISMDFQQANSNHWESANIRPDGYTAASDLAVTSKTSNYNFFLTYNKQFGDHNLNLVGGMEGQRTTGWYRSMDGRDLVGSYQELGTPNQKTNMSSSLSNENYRLGYFGRANYKFKDKYLLGFSLRRDGSTVFTPNYRWGTFKAFSAGWIISDEAFMGDFGRKNFLKIRGSFGQTGNSNIPSKLNANGYTNALAYGSSDITATNGTQLNTLGVDNLTWETTNSADFGVDFGFFNNRINGSIAYYNKYVKNLLLSVSLPPSAGVNSGTLWNNIGDLVNRGIELSLTSVNIKSDNFKWQTTFNVAFNHNEVKKLTPQIDSKGTGMVASGYITKVGTGIRDYYLADYAGIDSKTGLPKIYALDKTYYGQTGETRRLKDANGNDVLLDANVNNASSNYFHMNNKNEIPKYYGGLFNQFNYKSFDLSFLVSFSGGNYIYDQYYRNLIGQGLVANASLPTDYYDNYWKNPGDDAKYARLLLRGNIYKDANGISQNFGDSRSLTSQFLYKGDFVKLKSVTLGYTLPLKSKIQQSIQSIRLYASFENLYTKSKYPGWDPEGQGYVISWDIPQLFSASFGASVKF